MIDKVFSQDGALAKTIDGFSPRQSQIDMARVIEQAIAGAELVVIEAGTGTGKTYAYLAPALLSGKKTIISTGSKNLQEQLFHRDLPLMVSALGFSGKVAILKGRNNYLCPERLSRQLVESHNGAADPTLLSLLVKVRGWANQTKSGDLAQCDVLSEDSPIISSITSSNDNCLGRDCPSFSDCFVVKARKKALDADVVVVNHHLFLADLALKETGFAELIPAADIFIFDEAHQLPDIASHYFGQRLSSRQLQELAKDINIAYRTELRDTKQLEKAATHLSQACMELRLVLGEPNFRGNWRDMVHAPAVANALSRLTDALTLCYEVVKLSLGRSQLLDAAFDRCTLFNARLERVKDTSISGYSYWYECSRQHFSLNVTPLSVAQKMQEQIDAVKGTWIFTSATLTVDDNFNHFNQRLGLNPQQKLSLPSPFDYQRQALLCVPRFLCCAPATHVTTQLVNELSVIIEQNQGRCFFLCTSHQRVKELAQRFRELLSLPVLAQGEMPKQALLHEFLTQGNAVLVATSAFWEGVDVRGQALSCVIIDKLPFAAPDDPLLKARIDDCRLQGGDPFYQVQLPDAVITLKQGIGRLIRDVQDQGVLIICDNRLVTKNYAPTFLRSLPPIPRTRSLTRVSEFLATLSPLEPSVE